MSKLMAIWEFSTKVLLIPPCKLEILDLWFFGHDFWRFWPFFLKLLVCARSARRNIIFVSIEVFCCINWVDWHRVRWRGRGVATCCRRIILTPRLSSSTLLFLADRVTKKYSHWGRETWSFRCPDSHSNLQTHLKPSTGAVRVNKTSKSIEGSKYNGNAFNCIKY